MKLKEDPYKLLACKVFARYTDKQIQRLLEDEEYLAKLILEELWDLDYTGVFLDVVFESLSKERNRKKVDDGMRALAQKLTALIDVERLLKELIKLA